MLKKTYRLSIKRLQNPLTFQTPYFVLRFAKNNLLSNRYRFTVSKQVDKRAVVRNRLRRIFITSMQSIQPQILNGYDMVFSLRKEAIGQKGEILIPFLLKTLEKKGLTV